MTRKEYLSTISHIRMVREHTSKDSQILSEAENKRIAKILAKSAIMSLNKDTASSFDEYRRLCYKRDGNERLLTVFEHIKDFLGVRNEKIFTDFSKKVPKKIIPQEYGSDIQAPALDEIEQKEIYTVFMRHLLLRSKSNNPLEIYQDDLVVDDLVGYCHDHVLTPADLMMAKAGDSSRNLDKKGIKQLYKDFLNIVKESGLVSK